MQAGGIDWNNFPQISSMRIMFTANQSHFIITIPADVRERSDDIFRIPD